MDSSKKRIVIIGLSLFLIASIVIVYFIINKKQDYDIKLSFVAAADGDLSSCSYSIIGND